DTIARHGRRERWSRSVPAPRHRHGDLERRVAEADAYLQIMIELVNNTVNPVNGIYTGPTNLSQSHIKQGQPMSLLVPDTSYSSSEGEDDFYDAELEPTVSSPSVTRSVQCLTGQRMSLLVPDTSYSSSEGEDDFYHAELEPTVSSPSVARSVQSLTGQRMSLLIPDTSYSSSEGEDDFYDAELEPTVSSPSVTSVFSIRDKSVQWSAVQTMTILVPDTSYSSSESEYDFYNRLWAVSVFSIRD
ncbi:Oxysterol-binding protein, partial [Operophtera brumata]